MDSSGIDSGSLHKNMWNLGKIKEQQGSLDGEIQSDDPWSSVQETVLGYFDRKPLQIGQLTYLYDHLAVVVARRSSCFVADHFQADILMKGMDILLKSIPQREESGVKVILALINTWNFFFGSLINTLEACFYKVRLKSNSTIRKMCLIAFRDDVILKMNLGPILDCLHGSDYQKDYPGLCQMFLVLQSVQDNYPPNKKQLILEKLVAKVINPYLGYLGLYEGEDKPSVYSDEIKLASNNSYSGQGGCRRLSRPLALSSGQLDKLSELFRRTAIRSSILRKSSDAHLYDTYQRSLRTS